MFPFAFQLLLPVSINSRQADKVLVTTKPHSHARYVISSSRQCLVSAVAPDSPETDLVFGNLLGRQFTHSFETASASQIEHSDLITLHAVATSQLQLDHTQHLSRPAIN